MRISPSARSSHSISIFPNLTHLVNEISKGNELSPASKHDFRFKDYAPWVFRHLRGLFHLDTADYLVSLTSRILLSELGSPGKSGSFFYFSRDYRFVIKTLHHAEHKYLRKILRLYYEVLFHTTTLYLEGRGADC